MKLGEEFEILTQTIQKQLAPDAVVGHNEFIVGKSGVRNQIDVTVRAKIGQYNFFLIIECKDEAKKVGVETIRGFRSKVQDVGAMQGVLVSKSGFTEPATTYAESEGIILYTLVNTEQKDWSNIPLVPLVIGHISLGGASIEFFEEKTEKKIWPIPEDNNKHISLSEVYLIDMKEKCSISIKKFLENAWDAVFQNREPKKDELFESERGRYFLRKGEEPSLAVYARYSLNPNTIWYYGHLSLKECKGFLESGTGSFFSGQYRSNIFSFSDAIKTWPQTTSREDIPFKPEFVFFMGHFFAKREVRAPERIIIEKRPQ